MQSCRRGAGERMEPRGVPAGPDKTAEATLTETCYKLSRRAIVRGLTPERNRFCLALQVMAKTRP